MTLQYVVTNDMVLDSHKFIYSNCGIYVDSQKKSRIIYGINSGLFILITAIFFIRANPEAFVLSGAIGILLLIYFVRYPKIWWNTQKDYLSKLMEAGRSFDRGLNLLTVTAKDISFKNDERTIIFPLCKIKRVESNGELLFIFIDDTSAHYIPERAFESSEQRQAFLNMVTPRHPA